MQETVTLPKNIEFETVQNCDLCGSEDLEFWDSARSNTLSRCRNCGLVFTNPRIANSTVKDKVLYSETYFKQKSRMTEKLINARKKSYHMEIDSLQKFVTGGQILDVGCGMGIFLDWFDDNWEKHGCDVSSYALKEAQKRGIKVYLGEFEELDFGNSQFDVVYFRASLHHAYSPQLCLKKAYELLKPNGIVAVCMSNNHDGLAGRLFKAHIKSYEQAHNYLFSKQTLRKYLETTGFKILKIGYPYFGTGYETRKDLMQLIPTYIKYLQLRLFKRLTKPGVYDFSSPAFYGNYINIFAKR